MRAATIREMRAVAYGPDPSQCGDLFMPGGAPKLTVALLHGGFWRMPYGRDETGPVARDLAARGFAVWNLEYRRLGAPGGGWPGTFADVSDGLDRLAGLAAEIPALDPSRVVVAGHSAGGQLALWAAARSARGGELRPPSRVRPLAAAGLAAITDLAAAFAAGSGRGAVAELLAGSPAAVPARYAEASPLARLPLGVPHLVLHGALDDAVSVADARRYAAAARACDDPVEFIELPDAGHFDPIEPASGAHAAFVAWLERLARSRRAG